MQSRTIALTCLTAWLALPSPAAATLPAQEATVQWHSGAFDSALSKARARKSLVFVYFWMNGSSYCEKVYGETLSSPEGAGALGNIVCVGANATEEAGADLVARFNVSTLPTMLFLTPDGDPEDAILGYIPPAAFAGEVQRILAGTGTVSDLRRIADASPNDLALRYQLANKLSHVGDRAGHDELVASIKRDDPNGRTVVGAQLILYDVLNEILAAAADPNDPSTFDVEPMVRHLASVKPAAAAFEGWNWVRTVEQQRGNRAEARAAARSAWPHVAIGDLMDWADEIVWSFWGARDELSDSDKTFLLTLARAASDRAVSFIPAEDDPNAEVLSEEMTTFIARHLDGLACAFYLNGQLDDAIATVERAIALDPGGAEHQTYLELFQAQE